MTTPSTFKLTAAIKDDHQENTKKAAGNADAQARWARQLTWEVARHAVGEEIVVYPLMEKHLGEEGLKLTNQDREDHLVVKKLLYQLEDLQPGTLSYDDCIGKVMSHLREHNDSEEKHDLPKLEPKLGGEGSSTAAASFTRTKQFAPTRTHPGAPDRPPFETLVGLLAAPVDKLKDMFAKFPTKEMKENAAES
ncbi:hypothetical protein ONZ45_g18711 [Pleurotus djamor]|nr:hypothetical protein ONZ45_g18711 [Pleurotus djamor]